MKINNEVENKSKSKNILVKVGCQIRVLAHCSSQGSGNVLRLKLMLIQPTAVHQCFGANSTWSSGRLRGILQKCVIASTGIIIIAVTSHNSLSAIIVTRIAILHVSHSCKRLGCEKSFLQAKQQFIISAINIQTCNWYTTVSGKSLFCQKIGVIVCCWW